MSDIPFFFVSDSDRLDFIETEETHPFALVSGVVMVLGVPSTNGRVYRFSEAKELCRSLLLKDVYFGTDWKGAHDISQKPIGRVESASLRSDNKISAIIKVTSRKLINRLRMGERFLFSIMGDASKAIEKILNTGRKVRELINAKISSVQMLEYGTNVGFPDARMDEQISIQETVLFVDEDIFLSSLNEFLQTPEFNDELLKAFEDFKL